METGIGGPKLSAELYIKIHYFFVSIRVNWVEAQ